MRKEIKESGAGPLRRITQYTVEILASVIHDRMVQADFQWINHGNKTENPEG